MKLFGSKKGAHLPREDETPVRLRAEDPAQPELATVEIGSAPAGPVPEERETKKKNRFGLGLLIYAVVMMLIIFAGLAWLWQRMDVYERSRPDNAMEAYMSAADGPFWRALLEGKGVADDYIDTLDLASASYYKKLDVYTDAAPAYGIRFGGKTLLTATLAPAEELPYDSHTWAVDQISVLPSGLRVFAPADAALTMDGRALEGRIVKENAQAVTLSIFEQSRADEFALAEYALDELFSVRGLTVTDARGRELPLATQSGNNYYYPPLTDSYTVTAPSSAAVTVNGVLLTEENAAVTHEAISDLANVGAYVAALPEILTYTVEGLVAPPEIAAESALPLRRGETMGNVCSYELAPDPALAEEQGDYILRVFDAYIAFSGNRNGSLTDNYNRYMSYVVPGSELANRARKALESLNYAVGRDRLLEGVELGEVFCYAEDCFTAEIDYGRRSDAAENANTYLFVFVRYNNEWRVADILSKTSFI